MNDPKIDSDRQKLPEAPRPSARPPEETPKRQPNAGPTPGLSQWIEKIRPPILENEAHQPGITSPRRLRHENRRIPRVRVGRPDRLGRGPLGFRFGAGRAARRHGISPERPDG